MILVVIVLPAGVLRLFAGSSHALPEAFTGRLTIEQAAARAQQSGKPVLVLATADWCPPCRTLKSGPLRDVRVSAAIHDVTEPAWFDMTSTRDPAVQNTARQLGIRSIPAMILLRDGAELARLEGAYPADEILNWLRRYE